MTVRHARQLGTPDQTEPYLVNGVEVDPSTVTQPSDWDADHDVTGLASSGDLTALDSRVSTLEDAPGGSAPTVRAATFTLTPDHLTDSVVLPPGATLVDVSLHHGTAWDGGADLGLADGTTTILSGVDITASLLSIFGTGAPGEGETLSLVALVAGQGSMPTGSGSAWNRVYLTGGVLTATVTATSPTVGSTTIIVVYAVPA